MFSLFCHWVCIYMNIYRAPRSPPAIFGLCLSFVIYDVKFGQISIFTANHTDILACPIGIRDSQRVNSSVPAPPGGGWSDTTDTPGMESNKEIIAYKYILATGQAVSGSI